MGGGAAGAGGSSAGTGVGGGAAGASGGLVCPTTTFEPLPGCEDATINPCFACLCTVDESCRAAYLACEADTGCARSVDCGRAGCSQADCAKLAGSGLTKALAVRDCAEQACAAACGGPVGVSGGGGADSGGAAGSGDGGAEEAGGAGGADDPTAGSGGFGAAGEPGPAPGGAAGSDAEGDGLP
jgi:hypothetical protein